MAYIEAAYADGDDVHVVTQLTLSLLGLVVFPMERKVIEHVAKLELSELASPGWPQWKFELGSANTLGQLMRYLRNAIAHGHVHFLSESRELSKVHIQFENYARGAISPNWRTTMSSSDLRTFCMQLINLVDV